MTAASLEPSTGDLITFAVDSDGAVVRLRPAGEIDSSTAPDLRAAIESLLDAEPGELVLDLDGVTFLDSAGLSVLAAAHRRAVTQGVRLRVLASGRAVIRPLQITGLWELLRAEQVEPGAGSSA